ncbi:MAG: FtsX-like permease family protein [Acidimicrobiaceae bacterium]|nr:FtsX-like permease family protein [Acidimicrobiaceae bacterium]
MNFRETLRSALESIVSHRSRSVLTVLGILIGIAAVIVTVGLGQGSQQKVNATISSLGSNLLIVTPGSTSSGGVSRGLGSSSTLTIQDANALANHIDAPDISSVVPIVQAGSVLQANGNSWTAPVVGTTTGYLSARDRQIAVGSFFTQQDVTTDADVIDIGTVVAAQLFGTANPVGQTITIQNTPFQVIGELASAGSSATANEDDQVFIPISTAMTQVLGGSNPSSVSQILLQAKNSSSINAAYQEANNLLLQTHGITNPTAADFTITTETQLLTTATSVSKTLTFLLAGIAAVSLIVGGIGVMNIMLVSVAERVKEIGLRKALGATPSLIRDQFLTEALLLGLSGGVLGIALGVTISLLVTHLSSNTVILSAPVMIASVVISGSIGLIFGVYPASRAAALAPIEALRSE